MAAPGRRIHAVRCVPAYARHAFSASLQYRVSLFVWTLTSILSALIALAVWRSVALANDGPVRGLNSGDFVSYFLAAMLVDVLVRTDVPDHVSQNARSGKLSTYLLRPAHALSYYVGHDLNYRVLQLPVVLFAMFVLHGTFDGAPWPGLVAWIWFVPTVAAAYVGRIFLEGLVACAALRLVRTDGLLQAFGVVSMFLGGQFVPIDVLPGVLRDAARVLPFYWTYGFPIELASGIAPVSDLWIGLPILAMWITVLSLAFRVMWRRGVRVHESVGQ